MEPSGLGTTAAAGGGGRGVTQAYSCYSEERVEVPLKGGGGGGGGGLGGHVSDEEVVKAERGETESKLQM